jgi:hypothetical protein
MSSKLPMGVATTYRQGPCSFTGPRPGWPSIFIAASGYDEPRASMILLPLMHFNQPCLLVATIPQVNDTPRYGSRLADRGIAVLPRNVPHGPCPDHSQLRAEKTDAAIRRPGRRVLVIAASPGRSVRNKARQYRTGRKRASNSRRCKPTRAPNLSGYFRSLPRHGRFTCGGRPFPTLVPSLAR